MFDIRTLRAYGKYAHKPKQVLLDSAGEQSEPKSKAEKATSAQVDDGQELGNKIAIFQEQQIASEAMSLFDGWVNTDESDLDENEGMGDRLYALMVALADDNKDGEISDDEAEVIGIGLNAIADYLVEKGVSEENAVKLLTDFDNDTADNVREILLTALPEGDDEFYADMDKVIFSDEENQSILDDALADQLALDSVGEHLSLDAVYRKKFAIRNGKKMRINKRVSGKVRLSAKQKQAIRKAQRKAFTGAAKMRRLKSFRLRKRLGI